MNVEEIKRVVASNEFWELGLGEYQNMIESLLEHIDKQEERIQELELFVNDVVFIKNETLNLFDVFFNKAENLLK